MQAKMKKRRDHHRHHWKLKGTHAPLIYGGKLHGDSTDSRFVCLLFVCCSHFCLDAVCSFTFLFCFFCIYYFCLFAAMTKPAQNQPLVVANEILPKSKGECVVRTFVWMRFVYFLVLFFLPLHSFVAFITNRSFDFCFCLQ